MKTNTSNITNIKNTEKFKKIPKQYCRNIIVNYSRLKEILFEDERILYFLFVFISLLTIGYIYSIHHKNKSAVTSSSHSINKISTNKKNILANNLNNTNPNKFSQANSEISDKANPSYALTNHEINKLKRLLLPLPSHQHENDLLYSPPLPIVTKTPVISVNKSHALQSCFYKDEMYLPGDIVKTKDGWIRCTPTLSFSLNVPTKQQSGNPTWTRVQ
jgi:hypothetical protein